MDDPIILQYVGFETKGGARKYTFCRRGPAGESSNYFVIISTEAFTSHRARYQDAPAICSIRLRRELNSQINHPASTTFLVTNAELADYEEAHTPGGKGASRRTKRV